MFGDCSCFEEFAVSRKSSRTVTDACTRFETPQPKRNVEESSSPNLVVVAQSFGATSRESVEAIYIVPSVPGGGIAAPVV